MLGVALLGLAACAPQAPRRSSASGEVAQTEAAITDGTRETGMPAVVAVSRFMDGRGALCTGTAVSPYAVLTAKHCVFEETSDDSWEPVELSQVAVWVGHDLTDHAGVDRMVPVVDIRTTSGDDLGSDLREGDDIAALLLARALDTPVRQPARKGPSTGETGTIVGFGRTGDADGSAGVKFRADVTVREVGEGLVETRSPPSPCKGDSGGPLFDADGALTGITSWGFGQCPDADRNYYTRVAAHPGLVEDAVAFRPSCAGSDERCDGRDNDCDDRVDEGCTELGARCTRDQECSRGTCAAPGGGESVCAMRCDPRLEVPACPSGFFCRASACGTGWCVRGELGSRRAGEPCTQDVACRSGRCTEIDGQRRCARQCTPDEGDRCPTGQVCEVASGAHCGNCIPASMSSTTRLLGEACERGRDCVSGHCAEGDFCTRHCAPDEPCPDGFHCRHGQCVPGEPAQLGEPCEFAADCSASAPDCVRVGGRDLCVAPCGPDAPCQVPGFECHTTAEGRSCIPDGQALGESCREDAACRSGLCAQGVCTQRCAEHPCPPGFACRDRDGEARCVSPDTSAAADAGTRPSDGSGGGCAVTGKGGDLAWIFVLLLMWATGRRRYRKTPVEGLS